MSASWTNQTATVNTTMLTVTGASWNRRTKRSDNEGAGAPARAGGDPGTRAGGAPHPFAPPGGDPGIGAGGDPHPLSPPGGDPGPSAADGPHPAALSGPPAPKGSGRP